MSLLSFFIIGTGIAAIPGVYRLIVGPSMTDRVIGLDLLFAVAITFCLLASWQSGRTLYIDVAIGLSIIGFVATLAWARMIQIQHTNTDTGDTL